MPRDIVGTVITLPCARAEPVVQIRRRGRYPQNVRSIARERAKRDTMQREQHELEQVESAAQAMEVAEWVIENRHRLAGAGMVLVMDDGTTHVVTTGTLRRDQDFAADLFCQANEIARDGALT